MEIVEFTDSIFIEASDSDKAAQIEELLETCNEQQTSLTLILLNNQMSDHIATECRGRGIPFATIDPLREETAAFNPFIGNPEQVSEKFSEVLRWMFGSQEFFFAVSQETVVRNTIRLLKMVYGDDMTLIHIVRTLKNLDVLKAELSQYMAVYGKDGLTEYFMEELNRDPERYYRFATGLRIQLEDITGNSRLQRIFLGDNPVDINRHLKEGGILLVNTAVDELGRIGDLLGILVVMSFDIALTTSREGQLCPPKPILFAEDTSRYESLVAI